LNHINITFIIKLSIKMIFDEMESENILKNCFHTVLLSAMVFIIYVISYRDMFEKLIKKVHLTVLIISSIFLLTLITFFAVAYFALAINHMRGIYYSIQLINQFFELYCRIVNVLL